MRPGTFGSRVTTSSGQSQSWVGSGPGYRSLWRLLRLSPDDSTGQAGESDTDTVGAG